MTLVTVVNKPKLSTARQEWQQQRQASRIHNNISKPVRLHHLSTLARIVIAFAVAAVVVPWWMGVVDILRAVFGH